MSACAEIPTAACTRQCRRHTPWGTTPPGGGGGGEPVPQTPANLYAAELPDAASRLVGPDPCRRRRAWVCATAAMESSDQGTEQGTACTFTPTIVRSDARRHVGASEPGLPAASPPGPWREERLSGYIILGRALPSVPNGRENCPAPERSSRLSTAVRRPKTLLTYIQISLSHLPAAPPSS